MSRTDLYISVGKLRIFLGLFDREISSDPGKNEWIFRAIIWIFPAATTTPEEELPAATAMRINYAAVTPSGGASNVGSDSKAQPEIGFE